MESRPKSSGGLDTPPAKSSPFEARDWIVQNAGHQSQNQVGKAVPAHPPPRYTTSAMSANEVADNTISTTMPGSEIISALTGHNCENLTDQINFDSFSTHPFAAGGFGDVYSGSLLDGTKIAIKTIRLYTSSGHSSEKYLKQAARELYTWSKCKHPNILSLIGLVEFRGSLAMASHWAENGNLLSYLKRNPSVDRCQLSTSICEALVYLHTNKIVHGDLKGANVLISNDGTPMLTDFGNASLEEYTLQMTHTATAALKFSTRWTPPELLTKSSKHTYKGDIYSLGMTILETVTGEVPFAELANESAVLAAVMVKKTIPDRPENLIPANSTHGNDLWTLLVSCWTINPELRPDASYVRDNMQVLKSSMLVPIGYITSAKSANEAANRTISATMTCSEIISSLTEHNCKNLIDQINFDSFSTHPFTAGGLGDVFSGSLHDGTKIAIKTIRSWTSGDHPSGKYHKQAAKELYTWSKCKHPNILSLIGVIEFRGSLAMVSYWAENGKLLSYLKRNPSVDCCQLGTSICEGLVYLHTNKIVHGGLKGVNVLISNDGTPMLTDFGNASLGEYTLHFTQTTSGLKFSTRWTPPEILKGSNKHTYEGDIYSLGMTILETITGEVPFAELAKEEQVIDAVLIRKQIPNRSENRIPTNSKCGNILWALLTSCWAQNPKLRPSASDIRDVMQPLKSVMLVPIEYHSEEED